MKKAMCCWIVGLALWGGLASSVVFAQEKAPAVYPTAILPFQERGAGVKGYGEKVSDLLFAALTVNPNLLLVERAEIEKLLSEHELNLSGMVEPATATKVGQLTGAKLLVTGSVIEADRTLYLVAKIIGTETSRILGESVKGQTTDELGGLVESLAASVAQTIVNRASELVAPVVKREDRVAALKEKLWNATRPSVAVSVTERHVGQVTVDPAAQTEIALLCKETGFDVVDGAAGATRPADILITGEGFSEFAVRRGNLVSVKARVEIKAVDRQTGKVLAVDRQTAVVVDLAEHLAGKAALQEAAAAIAERMLPKLTR
ncbi:MAG: CsgG/HfaB family protein [Verrucomicrobia bacterium]|nr:CsgG/HfaB family protein [Verrucomicrobiota bacterium]MBU1909114.1 CsgG/HfaB family protein [Verrucomicrobiota bacterium]